MDPKSIEAEFAYEWRQARRLESAAKGNRVRAWLNLKALWKTERDPNRKTILLSTAAWMLKHWPEIRNAKRRPLAKAHTATGAQIAGCGQCDEAGWIVVVVPVYDDPVSQLKIEMEGARRCDCERGRYFAALDEMRKQA